MSLIWVDAPLGDSKIQYVFLMVVKPGLFFKMPSLKCFYDMHLIYLTNWVSWDYYWRWGWRIILASSEPRCLTPTLQFLLMLAGGRDPETHSSGHIVS